MARSDWTKIQGFPSLLAIFVRSEAMLNTLLLWFKESFGPPALSLYGFTHVKIWPLQVFRLPPH